MPPAVKKEPCSVPVKNYETLEVKPCGTPIFKGKDCPNRGGHQMPMKSGFCSNGNCEGTNKKSYRGKPQPTCKNWIECPCECHLQFDMMFKMAEMPRQVVDNSGYVPDRGGFIMPTAEERIAMHALSSPRPATVPHVEESVAPDLAPPSIVRPYAPTASGRAAAGQLEFWVKRECDTWLVESKDEDVFYKCTPGYLAEKIGEAEGIRPPSVGAISAVFDRWVKIGFAVTAKKPTRFIKYTEDGIKYGLDEMKVRHKRSLKSREAQAGRRIGRG